MGLAKIAGLYFWVAAQKDYGDPKMCPHLPQFLPNLLVETKTSLGRRIFGWLAMTTATVAQLSRRSKLLTNPQPLLRRLYIYL
jgi:hypothetical protein